MTMVVGCKFKQGGVLVADSRITYGKLKSRIFGDRAQKLVSLTPKMILGYAGDIAFVEVLLGRLRKELNLQSKLRVAPYLASQLGKIAAYHYQQEKKKRPNLSDVALILAATSNSGRVHFWEYSSPSFDLKRIDTFSVIGSGEPVAGYIQENYTLFDAEELTLKEKADKLHFGIQGELSRLGIESVGGMMQVLLLDGSGIFPLSYTYLDISPEKAGRVMRMEWQNGQWLQKNLEKGIETALITPDAIIKTTSIELRMEDYKPELPTQARWYLSHFLTCMNIETTPTDLSFEGVMTGVSAQNFPASVELLASVSFWGSTGEYDFSIVLHSEEEVVILLKEKVNVPFPVEEVEFAAKLQITVNAPRLYFIECYIGEQLLARRPLLFSELIGNPKDHSPEKYAELQDQHIQELLRASVDAQIEKSKKASLAFFSLCNDSQVGGTKLRFEGQIKVIYWEKYPLYLPCKVAVGLRLPKGKHKLKTELVNAVTRTSVELGTTTIVGSSSCMITPTLGNLVIPFFEPGSYYLNLLIDDEFVGSLMIFAETSIARHSYSLFKEDIERIEKGELLILPIRSQKKQAKEKGLQ